MAIQVGKLYEQLNNANQNSVYVLKIPSLGIILSTDFVQGFNYDPVIMARPTLPRQQVELLEGRTSLGNISVQAVNQNGFLERLLSRGIADRDSELYQGFNDLPFEQYILRHTGRIQRTSARSGRSSHPNALTH